MERNCLTCKWEPEWSEWTKGEYSRCHGYCKFPVKKVTYPATYRLTMESVTRFSDDSGIPQGCRTWEKK